MQITTKKQMETIDLHKRMKSEQLACEHTGLHAHYDHLLFSLTKIIESYGPSPEYYEWLNSASST
jgi:hypothetical protein